MTDLLSLNPQLDRYLSERNIRYFSADEIAPRGVYPDLWPNIIPTLRFAMLLREEFGPTAVNSGFRDAMYNESVGGAPQSLHVSFNALDLVPRTGTPHWWNEFLLDLGLARLGGVGKYQGFVHLDTRWLVLGRPAATWEG